MKTKRTALLLAIIIAVATLLTAMPTVTAGAATASEMQYFLDTVGPMCTNDMRDNKILASVSVAQAIWESGWGTSTLAKEANNLFGIRAYSTWGGMVYDRNEKVLYASWASLKATKGDAYVKEYSLSFWRAYTSWQESVNDHSALFNKSPNYENIRGNYDYKSVCKLLVDDNYCADPIYTDCLIKVIEQYDLEKYNYDFGNGNGSVGNTGSVSLKPTSLYMEKGATYTLNISASSATYTVSSSNTAVVSVTGNTVTAIGDGTASLSLSAEGKSASCSVTVKSGYGCIVADGVYVKCLVSGTASIPAEAKSISAGAFNGTKVDTVVVGNSVSSIEDGAFNGLGGGLTLFGQGNGVVETFANKNSISYVNLAGWTVDRYTSILSGIEAYTTAAVVDTYYGLSGVSATVKSADGTLLSDTAYVGTGCKVTVSGATYIVEVKGDTNGDGKTSTADLISLKVYLAGDDSSLPDRVYRRAADYNSDNRITTADYIAIAKNA